MDELEDIRNSLRTQGVLGTRTAIVDQLVTMLMDGNIQKITDLATLLGHVLGSTEEERQIINTLYEVAQTAQKRLPAVQMTTDLRSNTFAGRMLRMIADRDGMSNEDLAESMGVDYTAVSRGGRLLTKEGVAVKVRMGKYNQWTATPKGRAAIAASDEASQTR